MKWGKLLAIVVGGLLLIALMVLRSSVESPALIPSTLPAPIEVSSDSNASAPSPSHSVAAPTPSHPPAVATTAAASPVSGFEEFNDWVARRLNNDSTADSIRGEALAWKRREAMLELIESDPERALQLSVPFSWRQAFPENVTRHFERWIDARGDFEVAMAESMTDGREIVYRWAVFDEKRYRAFVYGNRLAQNSRRKIPLHGITLDDKVALTPDPIRFIEAVEAEALEETRGHEAEYFCTACGKAVATGPKAWIGEIGGETRRFCCEEHAILVNQNLMRTTVGGTGGVAALEAGGSKAWTQGRKDVLYIRVNFPDDLTEPNSEASAYATMDAVNGFYVENSFNQTWLSTTVTPLLTLPQVKAWYATAGPDALLSDARTIARKAGFDTVNYDRDIVSHTEVPGFDWGGLALAGDKGVWLQAYGVKVTAHELGHNSGLRHANFWDTDAVNTGIYGTGTTVEYGNIFDTMGNGTGHFGAMFKHELDWLPSTAVHTVTTSGVYRLHPFDTSLRTSGRFYAANVRKDFERDYWLEFRNRVSGNPSLQNGILLNWTPWSESSGAGMIDTQPVTEDRNDAAVVIGRTFSDKLAGVHITPLKRGATDGEPWIDVQISLEDGAPNIPCCLKVEVEPTNAAPGQLVRLHATVADRDDDSFAYAWSFDDATFSTNNSPWFFKSWSQPGEHIVRCEVSDMRGGRVSANVLVRVGSASNYRITGVVLDESGNPVEDVFVHSGDMNGSAPITSFTDSTGGFVLPGVSSWIDLQAAKYGYTFEPAGWFNPFFITSNTFNINLIARALTNVTLTVSTNLLIENVSSPNQLTLTRSGSVSNSLGVMVFVSGTASVPGDLTFTPALAMGTNNVVIPAGTNRVVFNYTPVNDGTVEPTEVLYVTIRENENYVVTSLAEGRITIMDDDQTVVPSVAVEVLPGPVLENGMNNAGFRFTRTGSTASDLPVTYSVGGTAIAAADYATLLGTVIIPAGSASATVELRVLDDKDVEPNETVSVTINSSAIYDVASGSAEVTILDDDVLVVTVSPTATGLGEPGGTGRFTVKRDGDQTSGLVVYYTVTGSASNGVDYVSPSGSVTIRAGAASAGVIITALDDLLVEGDETVTLVLSTNAAYDIGTPSHATLVLRDNEHPTVTVTAPDDTASEPGDDFGRFTITRTGGTGGDLIVDLAISGTALAGSDYVPLDNPVVIPAGSSSVNLTVIAFDDLFWESIEETVMVALVSSTNYNVGSPSLATVNILDNDFGTPAVGFAFATFAAPEDESPGLPVILSHTSSVPITVKYQVIGGTASASDYSLPPGMLTFEPGEWGKSIPLPIVNDTLVEQDETIRVTLYDPLSATHDGNKIITYTIQDDDLSSVSVTATTPTASEVGPVAGNFRITRTGGTNADLNVNFQITGTASTPSDCPELGTSAMIPAGLTFVDLAVIPVDDATVELDEYLTLTLIGAPGGKIVAPAAATITILDANTNGLPVVSLSSTNQPYAVEGGNSGAFVLARTGSTNNDLMVHLATGGSAQSGVDYSALPVSIMIPAGQSSVTIPVTPLDDGALEGEETVIVSLTVRDTYRVAYPGTAKVVIQDDEQSVWLVASDFEASEPGDNSGEFAFTRFGTTNTPLQVFYSISGSAGNGVDFVAISNFFVIPAGQLSSGLIITPLDDALVEGREQLTLTLQANAAYTIASPSSATMWILDDEPMVSLTTSATQLIEGSQTPAILTVWREGNPDQEFTARLVVGGSATYGTDYPPFATNVFFNCGIVAVDLLVFPTNEITVEPNENITVALLSDPSYSRLSPSNAIIQITDVGTNLAPAITITSPTTNLVYLLPTNVNMVLEAAVTDEDTNALTLTWAKVSGPESLYFGPVNQANTTVSFTNSGVYVLRLTADDGLLSSYNEVTVVVGALSRLTNNPLGQELLHWTFDEGSGPVVFDLTGHERHGTIHGQLGWITNGVEGGALNLSGTNNFVETMNDAGFLNGLTRFSLSCWINPSAVSATHGLLSADSSGQATTFTLATRSAASCGLATNVIEGTLATACGEARFPSAANALSNGWQHIALTWSNGLAPSLYINGKLDQPDRHKVPLLGELVNCPQFFLGKGPFDIAATWAGLVDELRVFPWYLSEAEVGTFVAGNFGAVVQVPTNAIVPVVTPVELTGIVTDDNRPSPPGDVILTWSQVSGPLEIDIPNPGALTNEVSFTQSGDYVFRLVADDGQVKIYEDLPVTVVEPPQVYVYPSDSHAAELGPDTGEFTFARNGDLGFELTVFFTLSGTASNGADYVQISQTNSVTFPVGASTQTIPITPFLDHRTEGDETIIITLESNVIYTIISGQATVTIQDSPYGVWNIARFTLEELTDPALSGETADYDHDGVINFVEYASNRDPKSAETNSLLQTSINLNASDGREYITLMYQRRVGLVDVAYAASVSTNLVNWLTGPDYVQEISATPDPNGLTETVRTRLVSPWPANAPQFVTVRVWLLATGP